MYKTCLIVPLVILFANMKLLDTFFFEDCNTQLRQKLLDVILENKTINTTLIKKYTFNRFNIILNFEAREVTLEDDLTTDSQGEYKLSLDEFEKALQEHK